VRPSVTLIDYGAGNATSVERALQKLDAEAVRAKTRGEIERASALILPGVGHFAALIRALDEQGRRESLLAALERGVPFLGICLGLQVLYDASDEAPDLCGLALFHQRICALPANVKLPHMGWNQIRRAKDSKLLEGIASGAHFYFAHSYAACVGESNGDAVATCMHGTEFVAVVEQRNVHAVQFHPEKSGEPGARLLANFLGIAKARG
jgi:imidazole glycerol-phosphate synthase subunit HisH